MRIAMNYAPPQDLSEWIEAHASPLALGVGVLIILILIGGIIWLKIHEKVTEGIEKMIG